MSVVLFIIPHELGGIDDGNGLCDQFYKSYQKAFSFFTLFVGLTFSCGVLTSLSQQRVANIKV